MQGRAVLLTGVIDLAVTRRRWVHALQGDPVIVRLLTSHEPLLDLVTRVYSLLLDNHDDPAAQVRAAIVAAAIVNPLVARLDDATLRAELIEVTRRLFELPY